MLSKLFKLFGKCYHCWHTKTDGECRWKIRINKNTDCNVEKQRNPFINSKGNVNYVMKETCCKCGAVRLLHCEDWYPDRGLKYPEYVEPDDGFRYTNANKML